MGFVVCVLIGIVIGAVIGAYNADFIKANIGS